MVAPITSLPWEGNNWGPLETVKNHINGLAASANGNFYNLDQAVKKLEERAGITAPAPGATTPEQKIAALEGRVESLTKAVEALQNRLKDTPQTTAAWG